MTDAAPETPSRSPSPKLHAPSPSPSLGGPRRADSPLLPSPGSNSNSTASLPLPAHRMASTRSMLNSTSPPPPSRSAGRNTPPAKLAMTVTEQIARQTRKSTVLDPKNALLILAIPDYDDYKIMQPYSCRSLSNRSKFVGGRDFITRHNPQEVNDFKKQYSRDVGNLNRHRSIVAPPNSTLMSAGMLAGLTSSESIGLLASPPRALSNNNSQPSLNRELWRKTFTASMKACWVLTDFGIQTLIGPEYRLSTRVPVLPALPLPRSPKPSMRALSCRSAATSGRPETPPLSSFSSRESARIGVGVDLTDEKTLAALSRLAAYSPKCRAHTPPCSPSRRLPGSTMADVCAMSSRCRSSAGSRPLRLASQTEGAGASVVENTSSAFSAGEELLALAPYTGLTWENEDQHGREQQDQRTPSSGPPSRLSSSSQQTKSRESLLGDAANVASSSPTRRIPMVASAIQPFAMEVSPPSLTLGTLHAGQVYLFPVRVRNVGFRQERFRVNHVAAMCAGFDASISEASYQREAARLAPGLAAVVTVALSFHHPGRLVGSLRVEAEGLGTCDIDIRGVVR